MENYPRQMSVNAKNMDEVRETARRLLESVKGIERARVEVDERGRITSVSLVPKGADDRSAMRNAQSALMAVLGQSLDINCFAIVSQVLEPVVVKEALPANVVEIRSPVREAARVAFDTLRAAQDSFHGFQFEGAELVSIATQQYVVVAVRRGEFRFSGSAPVLTTVGRASARAILHAVSVAAMDATHLDLNGGEFDVAMNS